MKSTCKHPLPNGEFTATQMREVYQQVLDALKEACGGRCNAEYNPCSAREAMSIMQAAVDAPTSGDYALGYAEGFNDACKKGKGKLNKGILI